MDSPVASSVCSSCGDGVLCGFLAIEEALEMTVPVAAHSAAPAHSAAKCRSGHTMDGLVSGKTNKPYCTVCNTKIGASSKYYVCSCTTACAACASQLGSAAAATDDDTVPHTPKCRCAGKKMVMLRGALKIFGEQVGEELAACNAKVRLLESKLGRSQNNLTSVTAQLDEGMPQPSPNNCVVYDRPVAGCCWMLLPHHNVWP